MFICRKQSLTCPLPGSQVWLNCRRCTLLSSHWTPPAPLVTSSHQSQSPRRPVRPPSPPPSPAPRQGEHLIGRVCRREEGQDWSGWWRRGGTRLRGGCARCHDPLRKTWQNLKFHSETRLCTSFHPVMRHAASHADDLVPVVVARPSRQLWLVSSFLRSSLSASCRQSSTPASSQEAAWETHQTPSSVSYTLYPTSLLPPS